MHWSEKSGVLYTFENRQSHILIIVLLVIVPKEKVFTEGIKIHASMIAAIMLFGSIFISYG